jgi:hypothetical protein
MGRVGSPGHAYDRPRFPRAGHAAHQVRPPAPVVVTTASRPRRRLAHGKPSRRTPARHGRFPPRWTLTAPESHMLHWLVTGRADDLAAFRLGLQELVLREALRVEQAWICGRTRRWRLDWLYSWGPRKGGVHEVALMPLLGVHADAWRRGHWAGWARDDHDRPVEGVRFKDLMYARSFWRASWHGYLNGAVAAALRRRGLLTPDRHLTDEGRRAEQQLERWLRLGRQSSPTCTEAWARRYLRGAGMSALLLPEALPGLARHHGLDPSLNIAAFDAGPGWLGTLTGFELDLDCGGCDGGAG